jgi:hypothetical protein
MRKLLWWHTNANPTTPMAAKKWWPPRVTAFSWVPTAGSWAPPEGPTALMNTTRMIHTTAARDTTEDRARWVIVRTRDRGSTRATPTATMDTLRTTSEGPAEPPQLAATRWRAQNNANRRHRRNRAGRWWERGEGENACGRSSVRAHNRPPSHCPHRHIVPNDDQVGNHGPEREQSHRGQDDQVPNPRTHTCTHHAIRCHAA